MTREEAIEVLKDIQYQFQCSVDDAESEFTELGESEEAVG